MKLRAMNYQQDHDILTETVNAESYQFNTNIHQI